MTPPVGRVFSVLLSAVVTTGVAGCVGGSPPSQARSDFSPDGQTNPSGPSTVRAPAATGVDVTSEHGFKYRITVGDPPQTLTTVKPRGKLSTLQGDPTDAPPGHDFVLVTVDVANGTLDRNEPLDDAIDTLDEGSGLVMPGGLVLAVPAAASSDFGTRCLNDPAGYWGWYLPKDACFLTTGLESVTPDSDGLGGVQIPAGRSVSVGLVAASESGDWVALPSSAPIGKIELFFHGVRIPIPGG